MSVLYSVVVVVALKISRFFLLSFLCTFFEAMVFVVELVHVPQHQLVTYNREPNLCRHKQCQRKTFVQTNTMSFMQPFYQIDSFMFLFWLEILLNRSHEYVPTPVCQTIRRIYRILLEVMGTCRVWFVEILKLIRINSYEWGITQIGMVFQC